MRLAEDKIYFRKYLTRYIACASVITCRNPFKTLNNFVLVYFPSFLAKIV
jgi:hypothetical protein